jgi:hypothetical protein
VAVTLFIAVYSNGCASRPAKQMAAPPPCPFEQIYGDLFEFLPSYPGGERYGYFSWKTHPDSTKRLPYFNYVGRKGKLTSEIITTTDYLYRKAILENCEVVFAEISKEYPVYQGAVLAKDLARARALIGKQIWSNNALVVKNLDLITADPKRSYPIRNIERLLVTDVVLAQYGHASGAGSFFIKVRKESGEEGLLKFSDQYFHESDPLPANTPEEIRKTIEQKKVKTGMTGEQVKLSWGKPKHVNKGAGAKGSSEQWIYGKHTLYFENGILSRFKLAE